MRQHSRKDFTWKKNKLFMGKEEILHLVQHKGHDHMFWIESADFSWCSQDFYNLTRAKDHGYNLAILWLDAEEETKDREQTHQETPLEAH